MGRSTTPLVPSRDYLSVCLTWKKTLTLVSPFRLRFSHSEPMEMCPRYVHIIFSLSPFSSPTDNFASSQEADIARTRTCKIWSFRPTRQDILSEIVDWATSPSGAHNVFWLYGSGKSTLSTTIASYFCDLGRLGAHPCSSAITPLHSADGPKKRVRTFSVLRLTAMCHV